MTKTLLHPRFVEGTIRQVSTQAGRVQTRRDAAIDSIDEVLWALREIGRSRGSLRVSISIGPFVAVVVREYEDLRARLAALKPDPKRTEQEIEMLLYRLGLLHELVCCFNEQWASAAGREPN